MQFLNKIPGLNKKHPNDFYDNVNYFLMILGVLVVIIGFMLMAGGKQSGAEFHFEEIYSFRRITLAPIVVLLGFVIEIYAVLRKPASPSEEK